MDFPKILMLVISASLLPDIKLRHQGEEDVEVNVSFAVNAKEGRNKGRQGIEKTALCGRMPVWLKKET